jgi:hypothetical protein
MRIAVSVSVGTKISAKQIKDPYFFQKKDDIFSMFLRST